MLRVLPSQKPFVSCKLTENPAEWWTRKKAKAKKCQLETIAKNYMMLLKLVHGVYDHKLREKFLLQKETSLSHTVQIAQRWGTVSHVEKNRGMDDISENVHLQGREMISGKVISHGILIEACPYCGREAVGRRV